MTSFFRSEEMTQCQLFLQSEAAYACVTELGELGLVQFKDLNPDVNAFQRKFVNEIRRCEEMERKLRYMEKDMKKDGLRLPDTGEIPKAPAPREMIDLEATFEKMESELREVNNNAEALKRNKLELSELKEVLRKTQNFFVEQHGAVHHNIVEDAQFALVHDETHQAQSVNLGFVAGVILREKAPSFERLLWFACRGNVFLRFEEIELPLTDPVTGDEVHKCVFIVFFQGEQLKARVKKICEGYKATLYPCPENTNERQEMLTGVQTRLEDLKTVLAQTEEHRTRVLKSAQKEMRMWIIKVRKIKAIYHTLNMCNFDVSHNSLIAECWCPVFALHQVTMALQHGTEISGSTVPSILHRMKTNETPPTFNKTSKFTQAWQNIVDSYGVADYRECNPAPFSIISFPFLFAVMFGDAGHGFLMFMFGLSLLIFQKRLQPMTRDNEIFATFFGGRYLITMMGLFSVYTGLLYNDVFAKSVNIFGSSWKPGYNLSIYGPEADTLQLDPKLYFNSYDNSTDTVTKGQPYPFGVDPIWMMSKNKITFSNSFKMKVSVILGISQMFFGVMISILNHLHFRNLLNIFFQFIPEAIFMLSIFGYLVALVFYKWLTYSVVVHADDSACAPSLLIHFINMFLMKYQSGECDYQATFYSGQEIVQICLLVGAVLCIPVLLCVKPFVLRFQNNARRRGYDGYILKHDEVKEEKSNLKKQHRRDLLASTSTEGLVHSEVFNESRANVNVSASDITAVVDVEEGRTHERDSKSQDAANGGKKGGKSDDDAFVKDTVKDEEEFDFSEVFIYQAIHTIEYCLGCVSHTASYLRLWALSLAHAQLSEVLWTMVFHIPLSMDMPYVGGVAIWLIWYAWAVLTICVLLVMEGLSAFLHTLRLHWVEFQSKFYHGTGYAFAPFNFKDMVDVTLDEVK